MENTRKNEELHKDKNKKVHNEPFCFFKWILKVEIIILVVFFIIGIIFNLISDKTKFVIKYNIEKFLISDTKNADFSYEKIIHALDENNYIENEEKEFISNILETEIEENIDYIDINETIKRLKNLRVSYHKKYYYNEKTNKYELKNPKTVFMKKAGSYNTLFNKMDIYECIDDYASPNNYENPNNYANEKFNFSLASKEVYFHELNHVMTKNSLSTSMDTFARNLEANKSNKQNGFLKDISNSIQIVHKNIFLETINELFTREYFAEYSRENMYNKKYDAYGEEMVYAYALAEILSEDTIRKYKFQDNESILISGLLEIDNNIDEVYKLLTSINAVNLYESKSQDLREENYKRIHDGYAYFYEKKYNKNMAEDLTMLLYFYGTPIQTNAERDEIRDFLEMELYDEIIDIIPKGYVSEDYKQNHKGVQVEYTKDGKKENLEIYK